MLQVPRILWKQAIFQFFTACQDCAKHLAQHGSLNPSSNWRGSIFTLLAVEMRNWASATQSKSEWAKIVCCENRGPSASFPYRPSGFWYKIIVFPLGAMARGMPCSRLQEAKGSLEASSFTPYYPMLSDRHMCSQLQGLSVNALSAV